MTISITAATHDFGAGRDKVVFLLEESSGNKIDADVTIAANGDITVTFAANGDITVTFAASQSANTIRVTIIG